MPESLASKGPRSYVGATYASVYLCQQLQSFLPGNALQFHTVWSFSVQNVIDELIHGRLTGYFIHFFLLLREFPCLEESDGMLCPCRSLGLDDKDQRNFLYHGSGCLYGQGLTSCRSLSLSHGRLSIHDNIFVGGSWELGGKVLAGA